MAPVDMARIREVAMGDEEFLRELITLFLGDAPGQIQALCRAVEDRDTTAVYKKAHRLKGASSNIGARPLSDLCRKLEQLGKGGDLEPAPALLRAIQEEYGRLQEFLNQLPV
jgi:HPt (histidine-containing phosphotransfer) domain-containing protein